MPIIHNANNFLIHAVSTEPNFLHRYNFTSFNIFKLEQERVKYCSQPTQLIFYMISDSVVK